MKKRNVIILNDKYSMEKDPDCWHLHEKYIGKDKSFFIDHVIPIPSHALKFDIKIARLCHFKTSL